MTNYVYIATSLDGYIATPDGGVDWLMDIPNPTGSDYGFAEFMSGIDALVMGRNTFEKVLSFGQWPYDKPVFVLSRTLQTVPEHLAGKVEIVRDDVVPLVSALNERGHVDLYIDGGRVIQSFLKADLIDEMIITRVSILLGDGVPLFGTLADPLTFAHTKTETLSDMLIQSHYTRARNA